MLVFIPAVNSEFFARIYLANSFKRHICHINKSQQWHDLLLQLQQSYFAISNFLVRVLFSRNFKSVKFLKNNNLMNFLIYSNVLGNYPNPHYL